MRIILFYYFIIVDDLLLEIFLDYLIIFGTISIIYFLKKVSLLEFHYFKLFFIKINLL